MTKLGTQVKSAVETFSDNKDLRKCKSVELQQSQNGSIIIFSTYILENRDSQLIGEGVLSPDASTGK
jgi:hypothetical protein